MEISKKVKFHDFTHVYNYHCNNPMVIKTKINDGPNLYKSFFEQFILSYLLNKDSLNNLIKKYYNIIINAKNYIIKDINIVIYNLNIKKKHHFYLMNYILEYSEIIIHKINLFYNLLSHFDSNLKLYG